VCGNEITPRRVVAGLEIFEGITSKEPDDVCFCNIEKVILSEYVDGMRECAELKCYCKEHIPNV
jgi:hypothetical protein